jgi:hypothetical protein
MIVAGKSWKKKQRREKFPESNWHALFAEGEQKAGSR